MSDDGRLKRKKSSNISVRPRLNAEAEQREHLRKLLKTVKNLDLNDA